MKNFCAFLGLVLLVACGGVQKKGVSFYDEYDSIKVDQMVGNNVTGTIFEKVIVCLNARRETRTVQAVTNVQVSTLTNSTVTLVTNQTISISTNYQITAMTNLVPPTLPGLAAATGDADAVTIETNATVAVTNAGPAISTNVTFSLARNQSATAAPNQMAANNQLIRTYTGQISTTSNNFTVSLMTNLVVTADTNQTVSYITNVVVANVTNVAIVLTNFLAHDYFLFIEYTPPPDFTLQSGESLVLLVDGVRYGFTQTPLTATYVGRKGYINGFYRVAPEVLVALANAKEVRVRLKGANSTVEREMTTASRQNFRTFLLKHFIPEDPPKEPPAAAVGQSERPATLTVSELTARPTIP